MCSGYVERHLGLSALEDAWRVCGLPGAWPAACQHFRELTPLEEASLQNQKLKAAYEARMARLDPSQAMQKTSLVSGAQDHVEWGCQGGRPYSLFLS